MKPAIKKLWVEALRSGRYKQGFGELRTNYLTASGAPQKATFCCLGVLCNIHAELHPKLAASQKDPNEYFGEESYLPERVAKWAGLEPNPTVAFSGGEWQLAELNDNGRSFKKIAKLIEEQL